jgi:diaminopimelate decarboxylase/aspartate kinase
MSRPWVVLKYGGTSVARAENWGHIADRVRSLLPTHRVCVVASALAGVSNALERAVAGSLAGESTESLRVIRELHRRLADELGLDEANCHETTRLLDELETRLDGVCKTGEAPPRLVARVMAVGELASTRLGIAALARHDVAARWVDARDVLCADARSRADDHQYYLESRVTVEPAPRVLEELAGDAQVVLTQGFIARTPEGDTCLLGRGGSDTSAALIAALVGADELEIWSDVHGMFTADPRLVPVARLIRRIGYREAQELAAMGARVLHPRCLDPVAQAGIPLSLHCVGDPQGAGTRIEADDELHAAVTAVTSRSGVTLLTLSTLAMWEAPGFLARAFAPFDELNISIDLVATSQSAVSVTLDKIPGGIHGRSFAQLVERLEQMGKVEVVHPCGVVSIVGRRIRTALHELGPAMEVFQDRPVRLVSDSSEDLNLSFVVDEGHASALTVRLHDRLFPAQGGNPRLGPTWEVLAGEDRRAATRETWWRGRVSELGALIADGRARYVYHLPTVTAQAQRLRRSLPSVDRIYYSMKANAHRRVLEAVAGAGLGIECVSAEEVTRARQIVGRDVPLLFTPNFCPMSEYEIAFEAGAEVTIDGPEPLARAPELFRGSRIGVRIDPGRGLGHHSKVFTAGARAKFGHPAGDFLQLADTVCSAGAVVVGVHAHVGSGILQPEAWFETGSALVPLLRELGQVEWLDLGGGLGVSERPGQTALDLDAVEQTLAELRTQLPRVKLRLEPGRFLVSEAGVLLAPVTQVRHKGDVRFIGLATGMNSFLRPALYGAWHGIHNLTQLDEPADGYWNVVGPICETSDVLGTDRLMPLTRPDDVILIENAGAYGAVMSSRYNYRDPAEEIVLDH